MRPSVLRVFGCDVPLAGARQDIGRLGVCRRHHYKLPCNTGRRTGPSEAPSVERDTLTAIQLPSSYRRIRTASTANAEAARKIGGRRARLGHTVVVTQPGD